MHRRRRSSDDVTSPNTYHEIENDDDDEDANDDHGDADGAGQNFQPQPGSSHHNDHNHDQYRQLQHQHELQRPEQSHQQRQQNTRAFVHSEAHPEPAAEESLLRHGRQRQPGQQRSGQSEPSDVAGRNAAQSGRAVESTRRGGQVMLDDKSVAEVGDSEWDRRVCVPGREWLVHCGRDGTLDAFREV